MSFFTTNDGAQVWIENVYSPEAVAGVSILVVASTLSLIAVLGMLAAILISSFKNGHAFIRSHLGAYFVSLILAELVQAIGSLMSARWIMLRKVDLGTFCATQAALKNAGNVSTALWSMIIAFHTFTLVFLKMRVPSWAFYATLVLTWCLVGLIVILGPAAIERPARGPFWGVSGYWCWITAPYSLERFMMEYLFMFLTAALSVILYILIFLRMRGNLDGTGFRVTLTRTPAPWQRDTAMSDPQIARVGKRMLLYPVAYVLLILPIAACRWSEVFGRPVPFAVTIFADTVFLLSGLVNAILYSTTRRVAPIKSIIPTHRSRKTAAANESFESGAANLKALESFQSAGPDADEPATPRVRAQQEGDRDLRRAPSQASSRSSVEDAGYPGPRIAHAAHLPLPAPAPAPAPNVPGEPRGLREGLDIGPPARQEHYDFL